MGESEGDFGIALDALIAKPSDRGAIVADVLLKTMGGGQDAVGLAVSVAGRAYPIDPAPGSPWENAYTESFNSRLRDELLDRELFTSLLEARVLLEGHRQEHNEARPHRSLKYETPRAFFEGWLASKKGPTVETVYYPGLS